MLGVLRTTKPRMQSGVTAFFERLFLRSWWVFLFFLVCYACYEHAMYRRNVEYDKLYVQYATLEWEKEEALAVQRNLKTQIRSQSDPAWIELTLMKRLGTVPEGQTKVFFTRAATAPLVSKAQ